MSIFAVLITGPGGRPVADRIQTLFPGRHHRLAEDQWLVSSDQVTAQRLSEQLGVTRNGIPSVVVFRVSSYFGMQPTDVWDWIQVHWEGGNGG